MNFLIFKYFVDFFVFIFYFKKTKKHEFLLHIDVAVKQMTCHLVVTYACVTWRTCVRVCACGRVCAHVCACVSCVIGGLSLLFKI